MERTRTGDGFPDWEIVRGDARLFDWYNEENVTELAWQHDGQAWRVAVCDRTRLVIRAAVAPVGPGAPDWYYWPRLDGVPGFVRCFYGPDAYGHTDYRVARELEIAAKLCPVGELVGERHTFSGSGFLVPWEVVGDPRDIVEVCEKCFHAGRAPAPASGGES